MSIKPLSGHTALVTGATRGAGYGMALELALAGALVFMTGRSSRVGANPSGHGGSIEASAEAIAAQGGLVVPVVVDHRDEAQVAALVARIFDEAGALDVVVNNAWGGHDPGHDITAFDKRFWEQDLALAWEQMFTNGLRNHLLLARHAVPRMLPQGRGLFLTTTAWDRNLYTRLMMYDLAKASLNRFAFALGEELKAHGLVSLAIAPGWMRTELVLKAFDATEADWQTKPDLATTESPRYLGRAVAALAADPEVGRWMGQDPVQVGHLAKAYGFTDHDGRQPEPWVLPDGV